MQDIITSPFRLPIRVFFMVIILLLAVIAWLLAGNTNIVRAWTPASVPPKIHYQGRLLDPGTNQPKADGSYNMLFTLYNQETGGSPLWSEAKSVMVNKGIFSTKLGDTVNLNTGLFNGQDLWLGISAGADPEMTPRQPLAYVPYAIYAKDAGTLNGYDPGAFAMANHTHSTLPIAYGTIQLNGTIGQGSYNISNVTWNSTLSRYEISITGHSYGIGEVTTATITGDAGSCPAGAVIRQSSVGGNLLIFIVNSAGNKIQCSFRFVSYRGQY
jgi:hypothetical protein